MIPTIDLERLDPAQLAHACETWGFFYLRGHGIDTALWDDALSVSRRFFHAPIEVKNRIRRSDTNCWGFYDSELTKNRPDWKEILDIGPDEDTGPLAGARAQWPEDTDFKAVIEATNAELHRIACRLTDEIRTLLGDDLAARPFDQHTSFLRLNYYPTCPDPAPEDAPHFPEHGRLGIFHHTDAGALTALLQDDVPGLQVFHEDAWVTVTPKPYHLIINIGDVVQVWSNDRFAAPLHRVLANSERERISLPYFLNPDYGYDYAPLGSSTPRYRAINWGQFRARRSAGDYADVGSEIQISDFSIET